MKRQSIVTHAIRQRHIPELPDSWVKKKFWPNAVSTKKLFLLIKCKGNVHPGPGDDGPEGGVLLFL
jgi:hypothetical protein